jgi:chaperonin cofactor prefoldin
VTQTNDINDRDRYLDRDLIIYDRRLTRLEETQLTSKEVKLLFNSMADKIDMLAEQIDRQFDWLEARCDRLESRCDRLESRYQELNRKLDLTIAKSPDRARRSSD